MIHIHYFICCKPGMEEREFHRYWKEVHGPLARKIPQLRRYVQSHRIPFGQEPAAPPFDGVAEVWLDSEQALRELTQSKEYREGALADEPNFIDMNRVLWVHTTDYVVLEGAPIKQDTRLVKGVFLIKRKPGMSLTDFRQYWKEVHGPIVLKLPGLRRYVQCHALDSFYKDREPRFDGVAQIWFDNTQAMERMMASREFKEESWPDGAKFIDQSSIMSFVAEEHRVIWPA